jgi:ABC-type transporter Mla subunit MlaD
MTTRSELKAGAVMLAGLLLGGLVLSAAGRWDTAFRKKQTLKVLFSDVQGLREGDPVQVMGLALGKVTRIEVVRFRDAAGPGAAVEVTARIVYPEAFPEDTAAAVDRTLTGNTVLSVVPGRSERGLSPGARLKGDAPVSMKELAGTAGSIARRIDDFVDTVADKEMAGAALAAVVNLKESSELAKSVMASLNRSVPATEHAIVTSAKNLEEFSGAMAGGKEQLSSSLANLSAASLSLARAGENADLVLAKSRDPLISVFSNADKTSANLKALSRQVRWQPWLLLKKPGKDAEHDRAIYNAALDFSEGACALNDSVKELAASAAAGEKAAADREKFEALVRQARENMEKSAALERRLWQGMAEAGARGD